MIQVRFSLVGYVLLALLAGIFSSCHPALALEQKPLNQIPILMYHEIGDGPNSNYTSLDDFQSQMQCLYDEGCQPVTLSQAYEFLRGGALPISRPVVLTFDDGYVSFYTKAWPVLKDFGYTAVVFITTDQIDQPNHMTWDHLAELRAAGVEVGSHTKSHSDLSTLGGSRLKDEVDGSKRLLEDRLGSSVAFLCYPAGKYNDQVIAQAKEAGYLGAVTTKPGKASSAEDPYLWPRVRIYRDMGIKEFGTAVSAGQSAPLSSSSSSSPSSSSPSLQNKTYGAFPHMVRIDLAPRAYCLFELAWFSNFPSRPLAFSAWISPYYRLCYSSITKF